MPRFPIVASATASISDLIYMSLKDRVTAHLAAGKKLHKLNVGDTYLDPPDFARADAVLPSAEHPRLHNYSPNQGEPVLLDAIEKYLAGLGRAVPRSCIQVTASGTTATNIILSALLNPGDELIIPSPYWPLVRGATLLRNAVPVEVPVFTQVHNPSYDLEAALEQAVSPKTVALYVNAVHNPTGVVLSDHHVDQIARVAARHDLWVILDEAYEELYFTASRPAPLWLRDDLYKRSIVMHTLSKAYAFCGGRIGFIHGPPEAMDALRALQTYTSFCATHPMQIAAARALDQGEDFLAKSRALYKAAGAQTARALGVAEPQGGTFLFVDVKKYLRQGESVNDLLGRCIDEGVLLAPGNICGEHFQHHIRICYTVVPPADLTDALQCLQRALGIHDR